MLRPSDTLTKTKIVASDSIRRKVVFSRLLKMLVLSIPDAKKRDHLRWHRESSATLFLAEGHCPMT